MFILLGVVSVALAVVVAIAAYATHQPEKIILTKISGLAGLVCFVLALYAWVRQREADEILRKIVEASTLVHVEVVAEAPEELTELQWFFLNDFGVLPPRGPDVTDDEREEAQGAVDKKLTERAFYSQGLFSAQEAASRRHYQNEMDRQEELQEAERRQNLVLVQARHAEERQKEFNAAERIRELIAEEKRSPHYFCELESVAHRNGLATFHSRNDYVRGLLPH